MTDTITVDPAKRLILSRDSVLPIGLVATVVVSMMWGAWAVRGYFSQLENRMASLAHDIHEVKVILEERAADLWRRSDMIDWVDQLLQLNGGTLHVPTVSRRREDDR
jgi:hypothetical protein